MCAPTPAFEPRYLTWLSVPERTAAGALTKLLRGSGVAQLEGGSNCLPTPTQCMLVVSQRSSPMAESPQNQETSAVFLSYASEDTEAAERIATALREAGIEVWFDKSELRGGDEWDAAIRRQIRSCALFIPLISISTHARIEGYFRLEWKLAIDRSHLIAPGQAFLLPVAIDATPQTDERIPERFRELQWTRLTAGETSPAFVGRVRQLLGHDPAAHAATARLRSPAAEAAPVLGLAWFWRAAPALLLAAVALAAAGYLAITRLAPSRYADLAKGLTGLPERGATLENSVAVLPFLDLSERRDEAYFADGISEELIDLLARDPKMHVPARTSSFYFKGRTATIAEIAAALHVGHLLEGSVRRSGETLRITVQLIRAETGFHVWSRTYDRPVADIFKTQDEIAAAVVHSLKLNLMPTGGNIPASVNPDAYMLVLKAKNLASGGATADLEQARQYLKQALELDPKFPLGWATFARVEAGNINWHGSTAPSESCARTRQPAAEALRLAPLLADTHIALATLYRYCDVDLHAAEEELNRASQLDSNLVLASMADFLTTTNRPRRGLEFALRAVSADPLNEWPYIEVAFAQGGLGNLSEAESWYRKAEEVNPNLAGIHALLANALLAEGKVGEAVAENAKEVEEEPRMMNLPELEEAQGHKEAAQRALDDYMKKYPDPYTAAIFYACRHQADRAITYLKELPPGWNLWDVPNRVGCLQNLQQDPRFQAIWAAQKLPPKGY